jgi:hypothetical protein
MPVFNTQGLPIQLVVQPDRNFSDLAANLQPGQVMRGRVSEVLADGKAVVNFRGVAVTAELKGVSLARGEVISVSVQDLKGQPVLRLLPQAPAATAAQAAQSGQPVVPAAQIDAEISAVLAQLSLPRDNFHAAVVQLLQGYSVPPSRESVAAVKELLASLPGFLEQPAPAAAGVPPASAPVIPAARTVETAPAPVAGQPVAAAPSAPRPVSTAAPLAPPPLPEPAVNSALSRGYNLGRLLAALVSEAPTPATTPAPALSLAAQPAPATPAAPPASRPVPAAPAAPLAAQPAPASPAVPAAAAPAPQAVPVSSLPATPVPAMPADATQVAQVLANLASANEAQPLPVIIESAVQAMQSVLQGKTELPAQVQQALTDIARDLASQLQASSPAPVRDLGEVAGKLNTVIRSMPGGNTPAAAPAGAPVPAAAPAGAPVQAVSVPVRSAAELAGALAGIIHEEVAQAVQPQVTIVASAMAATQASAETSRAQAPQVRSESRQMNTAPSRDSEVGGARTEAPRSAAPAPVSLPSAVREADAPVDVPRIMAVVAETAPVAYTVPDSPDPVQVPAPAAPPARPAPTAAQSQILSGAVVTVDARAESLASALALASGEPAPVPAMPSMPQPAVDPRVGFMPAMPALDAAGLYGANSAGGPRIASAEPAPFVPAPAASQPLPADARLNQASPVQNQSGQAQIGRDVVETAVFMHAFNLPPAREVARAAHEYLFGQAHLNESLQRFEDVAAAAGTRTLPAPVREALQTAIEAVRDARIGMEGDEMSASRLQGAVEKLGLGHESRLARAAGQEGEPRPTRQAAAEAVQGAQDTLKAVISAVRDRADSAIASAQSSPVKEALGAIRSSADDILQVVQSQQVGSVSRSPATQVMYVQLPIAAGNEMRGGEVHLSWKKEGEGGKNRRRDPRAPAMMNLNMETRSLGPVKVRMQMTGQSLSLVFQVNDPATSAFLSGEFGPLKDRLQGFSLKVDRCVAEVVKDEAPDESPRAVAPTSTVDFRA